MNNEEIKLFGKLEISHTYQRKSGKYDFLYKINFLFFNAFLEETILQIQVTRDRILPHVASGKTRVTRKNQGKLGERTQVRCIYTVKH